LPGRILGQKERAFQEFERNAAFPGKAPGKAESRQFGSARVIF
jgi:hypothetical protein